MHENLCRMVRGPPGVLIWEAGLVWSQVLHRGRRQGKFITFFILHTLTHANELIFFANLSLPRKLYLNYSLENI